MTKSNTARKNETIATEVEVPATVVLAPAVKGTRKHMITPTDAEVTELNKMSSTSARIRYLVAQGYSTNEDKWSGIANYLGLLTQHVRNVATKPLKKPTTAKVEPKVEEVKE